MILELTNHVRVLAVAVLAICAGAGVVVATAAASAVPNVIHPDAVDRNSYRGGWTFVVNRQPDDTVTPELRSDDGIRAACAAHLTVAELDGVTDEGAFMAGCFDAAAGTQLEPTGSR